MGAVGGKEDEEKLNILPNYILFLQQFLSGGIFVVNSTYFLATFVALTK